MTKNRKKILSKNSGGGDEECFLKGLFSIRLEDHRRVFLKTSPNRIRTQQSNRRATFLVADKKRADFLTYVYLGLELIMFSL